MRVLPYNPSKVGIIASLLSTNNLQFPGDLPEHGLIAFEHGEPIGCGFLRCIEGHIGMLEGFCTNKTASAELRSKSIDMIVTKLISWAKKHQLKGLIVYTSESSILKRLEELRFHHVKGSFMAINLKTV